MQYLTYIGGDGSLLFMVEQHRNEKAKQIVQNFLEAMSGSEVMDDRLLLGSTRGLIQKPVRQSKYSSLKV